MIRGPDRRIGRARDEEGRRCRIRSRTTRRRRAASPAVLAQCGDDLSMPSPCEGWTAQDVVDHVMGGPPYYTEAWGGQVPDVADDADRADPLHARESAALADTCRQPGVLEQMVPSPLGDGEIPAGVMFGILTSDTLIHTWDLARADRRRRAARPGPAPAHLGRADPDGGDACADPTCSGPPSRSTTSAPMQDRAMAWFGRQP